MDASDLLRDVSTALVTKNAHRGLYQFSYGLLSIGAAGLLWLLCLGAPGTTAQLWLISSACSGGILIGLVLTARGVYALIVVQAGPVG